MPHTQQRHHRQLPTWGTVLAASVVSAAILTACQEPAGLPPTLPAGAVSFSYSGVVAGTLAVEGQCYYSDGYPAADSACALAMDLGDTIRIRAVRDPRTIQWVHVNVEFPEDGVCGAPEACRIAFDRITVGGKVDRSFQATGATVTIEEQTADRIRGTFNGLAYEVDGAADDTVRIVNGAFDVPVDR